MYPFVGGSRAALSLEAVALRARLPPTTRLLSSWLHRSTLAFHSSGGLTQGMPPANSFPLTLSWLWHVIWSTTATTLLSQKKTLIRVSYSVMKLRQHHQ